MTLLIFLTKKVKRFQPQNKQLEKGGKALNGVKL